MIRKNNRIRLFLAIPIICYILYYIFLFIIKQSGLKTIEGKSDFDVTAILNISKERISDESETYNRKQFIEYGCVIDGIYGVTVVRVGKVSNIELLDSIYFESQQIPSRTGLRSVTPHIFHSPSIFFTTAYSVFILPFKEIEIDKINVFVSGRIIDGKGYGNVNGNIISKEYINDTTVSYLIESSIASFSFNDTNKIDLWLFYQKITGPILFNIFFTIDKDKNLYIGCVSINSDISKTLKTILEDNK